MKAALIAGVVAAIVAALGWSFSVESRLSAVQAQTTRAEREAESVRALMQSIDQRLARIEGKLEGRR